MSLRFRLLPALLFIVLCLSAPPAPDAAPAPSPSKDRTAQEPGSIDRLRDENRTLEAEVKLAALPQVYLMLDLAKRSLQFKSRGIELHRIEIQSWEAVGDPDTGALRGVFRLRARPAVDRPRVVPEPGKDPDTEPINLADMPADYVLAFDPGLAVTVAPPAGQHPWLWVRSRLREGWLRFNGRFAAQTPPPVMFLRLTLSKEESRSLAWSLTDGMPLLIGATTSH
jgi:hypothetical protein